VPLPTEDVENPFTHQMLTAQVLPNSIY
jgi:hypothetical protein